MVSGDDGSLPVESINQATIGVGSCLTEVVELCNPDLPVASYSKEFSSLTHQGSFSMTEKAATDAYLSLLKGSAAIEPHLEKSRTHSM